MAILKEIIGETAYNTLSEEVKNKYKEVDLVDSSNYVPKERFTQVNDEKNDYKKQITERDKQLNDLQAKVKDNEELSKEIEALKTANSTTASEYEDKLKKIQYDIALNNALKDSKAKDINLIKALLDNEKLKVNGEEIIGLKEQLETIRKEKDYLFEKDVPGTGSFNTGGKSSLGREGDLSLGERLAKEKTEQLKSSEDANKFFK
ncbi:phage scaffolding protein [Clostridium sp. YIM B02551]|uniref:phage scaffolding protein n=1 Tax=Clostridium sp. YIM B02551 TaxID=2910679 RepID=UPI001EEBEE94|nr:phage scaffolding protein [Clostridium sp. YIM B02551]